MGVIVEQAPITVAKHASGKYVTIDKVKKGLDCNCYCPDCGSPLIAKKGDKLHHHFSHQSHDNDSLKFDTCGYDYWRSLHLLTFKILSEADGFRMPDVKIGHTEMFLAESFKGEMNLVEGKFVKLSSIKYGYLTEGQKLKTIIATYDNSTFIICPVFSKEKDAAFKAFEVLSRKGKGEIPVIMIDMDGIKETVHPKDTETFSKYVLTKAKRFWSSHGSKISGLKKTIVDKVKKEADRAKEEYSSLLMQLEMKMDMSDHKIYSQLIKGEKTHKNFRDSYLSFQDFDQIEVKTKRHFLFVQRKDEYSVYITLSSDSIGPPWLNSNEKDICIWMSFPDEWRKNKEIGNLKDLKYKYYIPVKPEGFK
jgi:hypothetical protein